MPETPEIPDELPLAEVAAVIAEATTSAPEGETPEIAATEEVAEIPKEDDPMIEVHAPHESVHSWKDVFIHIAIIVVGLLIAVGLGQGMEYIHHRRELAQARRELAIERKINIVRFSVENEEFHRYVSILQNNLAIFLTLRQHPGKPVPPSLGTLRWAIMSLPMLDGAWTAAQHSGVVDSMPESEARINSSLYGRLNGLTQQIRDARTAYSECQRFRIVDPDPAHLSPEQLDQEIDLVSRALFAYRTMANGMTNLHSSFPDFTPAPSAADYRAITHAQIRSADDQRDSEALTREIDTFTSYERSLDQNEAPE